MYGANKKMLNLLILKVLQEHSDAEHLLRIKVMLAPIRGSYQPASKDAGFHYVQARLLLTRRRP